MLCTGCVFGVPFVRLIQLIVLQVMLRNVEENMHRNPSSDFVKYLMPSTTPPTKDFCGPMSELAGASSVRWPLLCFHPLMLLIDMMDNSSLMHEACRSGYVCDLL
jgi:hypothetical protein